MSENSENKVVSPKGRDGSEKIPAPNSSKSKLYQTFRKGGMQAVKEQGKK